MGSGPTAAYAASQVPSSGQPAPRATPPHAVEPLTSHLATKLNVVVIFIDAMRADMPWAGYPRNIAPRLTAFEKGSVDYTRAYALSSYTAMSVAGFLAGRYPGELQRSGYFFSAYPKTEDFFPERLQHAGVRTLAAHAHFYFAHKAGFRQGFDDYRMVPNLSADNTTDKNITGEQHLELAEQMLSEPANTKGQFFAWFHFMDPHDRYMKHDGYTRWGTGQRDRYDGEIAYTDHQVGELIDFISAQPWGGRTAIIVTADHGEAFGELHRTRHGFELWEPLVHVPMLIRIPGARPKHIELARSQIDLAPTIAELLGVQPDPRWHGTSLVGEARGETEPAPKDVIIDLPRTSDNFRRRALVHGRYKLISFGDDFRYQLYDVVADPAEHSDLRRRDKALFERMKQRYLQRVKSIHDVCPEHRHMLKGKRPERPC